MPSTYEFTEQENQEIRTLYDRLNLFSVLTLIPGILITSYSFVLINGRQGLTALPVVGIGLVFVFLGLLLRRPLDNLRNIVLTDGRDVPELMTAVSEFKQAFVVGGTLAFFYLVLVVWRVLALIQMGG